MQNIDTHVRCHPFSNALHMLDINTVFMKCSFCFSAYFLSVIHVYTEKTHLMVSHLFFQQINVLNILQITILLHVLICTTAIFPVLGLKTKVKHILLNVLWKQLIMPLNHMFVPTVWTPCGWHDWSHNRSNCITF